MRMDKGKPFMHIEEDGGSAPTFSESFLYDTVGKGDARFILGVAEEYEHVIEALGPRAVRAILDVKPRLVQRLGTGDMVRENLADANSADFERMEQIAPSEVTIDHEAADAVWDLLHDEYQRYFEPEKSMGKDALRLYHSLTEQLGEWQQKERKKEQDKAEEKLERKERRVAASKRRRAAQKALWKASEEKANKKELAAAVAEYVAAEDGMYRY